MINTRRDKHFQVKINNRDKISSTIRRLYRAFLDHTIWKRFFQFLPRCFQSHLLRATLKEDHARIIPTKFSQIPYSGLGGDGIWRNCRQRTLGYHNSLPWALHAQGELNNLLKTSNFWYCQNVFISIEIIYIKKIFQSSANYVFKAICCKFVVHVFGKYVKTNHHPIEW